MSSKGEFQLISKIAKRAAIESGVERSHTDWVMDIEFAHIDTPLRLNDFLRADRENFLHDVYGILENMNRETLELENCFLPRYAA